MRFLFALLVPVLLISTVFAVDYKIVNEKGDHTITDKEVYVTFLSYNGQLTFEVDENSQSPLMISEDPGDVVIAVIDPGHSYTVEHVGSLWLTNPDDAGVVNYTIL